VTANNCQKTTPFIPPLRTSASFVLLPANHDAVPVRKEDPWPTDQSRKREASPIGSKVFQSSLFFANWNNNKAITELITRGTIHARSDRRINDLNQDSEDRPSTLTSR